jgi:hypothetical protein
MDSFCMPVFDLCFFMGSRIFLLNWIFADFLFISFISPRVNYLQSVKWNEKRSIWDGRAKRPVLRVNEPKRVGATIVL